MRRAPGTMPGSRQMSLLYVVLSSGTTNISPGRVSPRGSSAPAPTRRSSFNSIPQGTTTRTLPTTPTPTATPTPTPTAWLAHIEILVDSYAEPDHYFCGSALSRTYDRSPESSAYRTTQQHAGHQEYPNPFAHTSALDRHVAGKFSHPCKILGTFPLQFP